MARPSSDVAARLANRERTEREARIRELRSSWNAPKRHVETRPPREGPWASKLARLEARLGQGFLIALIGGGGTGKTQMAVELMKSVTRQGRSALFCTALELAMRFKATYRTESSERELDVLRACRKPALLVIDEFSKRGQTEWEDTMFFELLNQRYGDKTDTVVVANVGRTELEANLGASTASRMQETGGIVECDWPSFREQGLASSGTGD